MREQRRRGAKQQSGHTQRRTRSVVRSQRVARSWSPSPRFRLSAIFSARRDCDSSEHTNAHSDASAALSTKFYRPAAQGPLSTFTFGSAPASQKLFGLNSTNIGRRGPPTSQPTHQIIEIVHGAKTETPKTVGPSVAGGAIGQQTGAASADGKFLYTLNDFYDGTVGDGARRAALDGRRLSARRLLPDVPGGAHSSGKPRHSPPPAAALRGRV